MSRPSVALSVICKNEEAVIARMLRSVKPYIDAAVIVDTGSATSETIDIAKRELAHLGDRAKFYSAPWESFSANRNLALDLARKTGCDFALFIDCDETIDGPPEWPRLDLDSYIVGVNVNVGFVDFGFHRLLLARLSQPWEWIEPVHERLVIRKSAGITPTCGLLNNFTISTFHDGARAKDPDRFLRDAEQLKRWLVEWPTNTRAALYLARSYRSHEHEMRALAEGEQDKAKAAEYVSRADSSRDAALSAYLKHADMEGVLPPERYTSLYEVANIVKEMGQPFEVVCRRFLDAVQVCPKRAEPLFDLAVYCRRQKRPDLGYIYALAASVLDCDETSLFVERSVYKWKAKLELAKCASATGRADEAAGLLRELLDGGELPPDLWRSVHEDHEALCGRPMGSKGKEAA